ncbi:MAG: 50S ribosomal protein L22 [Candidatus Omnitrophica bacterium]|nr:50S ribosomal protein L22 [Candidatus Omnitrophota bacterium]
MVTRAVARYIRITPRKFRQIVPLVSGKNPEVAIAILTNVKKKAAAYAIELLKSAVANAKRNHNVEAANLYISRMIADCGPTFKRFRAASMGRAGMIRKRTSHLTVELDEVKKPKEEEAKGKAKVKVEAKVKLKEKPKVKSAKKR